MKNNISVRMVEDAQARLASVVVRTPLELNRDLSERYKARVYLKREDLQVVRSYKLRGAFNCISSISKDKRKNGIVCASAGNHAQGVALSCSTLKVKGYIYMPTNTPKQKIDRVKNFGGKWVELKMVGETFDEANKMAAKFCKKENKTFVHPFDDTMVIAGQGTVGLEILEQLQEKIDFLLLPVGGGGLLSGVGSYVKTKSPKTKIVGIEPSGAPSMSKSFKEGRLITLDSVDKFIDGAAVKTVGKLNFKIAKDVIDEMNTVDEGKVCTEMISLYQNSGIVAEPAGALSVAALDQYSKDIKGKTVVCVISGGNNDISRYPEILERSLVHKGLKHYFVIEFSQKPGALRNYLDNILGKNDDITFFEYVKRNNKDTGPALVGVELINPNDLESLLKRMEDAGLSYKKLSDTEKVFQT